MRKSAWGCRLIECGGDRDMVAVWMNKAFENFYFDQE
jgi:hypothetical protein